MDIISRFDPGKAHQAHGGTILAGLVLPAGLCAPFDHAWGYLNGPGAMEPHAHRKEEVYVFTKGSGFDVQIVPESTAEKTKGLKEHV